MCKKRPLKLSAAFLKTVRCTGRFTDGPGGNGLSVLIKPTKTPGRMSITFAQRIRINNKYTNIGLGSYPKVTLAEARQRALTNMQDLQEGRTLRSKGPPTFQEAAEKCIEDRSKGWRKEGRNQQDWEKSFQNHVYPHIGDMPINTITRGDIWALWDPLWQATPPTAVKVAQRVSAVMRGAQERGHVKSDPTPKSTRTRSTGYPEPMKALHYDRVAEAVEIVEASEPYLPALYALKFTFLTVARSGEVRRATWDEIHKNTWTRPRDHIKSGKQHRVPLSKQALRELDKAAEHRDRTGLIFPSPREKIMNSSSLSDLLRKNGIDATVHRIRTTFTNWAMDQGKRYFEIEMSLAHSIRNPYLQTDLLKGRRDLMQEWADYLGI